VLPGQSIENGGLAAARETRDADFHEISREPSAVSFQLLNEGRKHALHFRDICRQAQIIFLVQVTQVSGQQQLTFQFTCRTHCDDKEAREFGLTAAPATSAMFAGIDAAARLTWLVSPNCSSRGNLTDAL
jgi:hypothetical protein